MIRLLKVTGDSLAPRYREGDFVFVLKIPFFFDSFKPEDVIVFRHPIYGILIKQVEFCSPDAQYIFVTGTNVNSVDSRTFGPIERANVIGKVIWHIRGVET